MNMKYSCTAIALFSLLIAAFSALAPAAEPNEANKRVFLFVGEPNARGWQAMMVKPEDRKQVTAAAMAKIGGKVLSYYFGLGDGKNYVTVELPDDNEVIQAVYLMRKPSGLLESYAVIELMSSEQMVAALYKSKDFLEIEKSLAN